jgi:hypothetical protein
MPRSCQPADLNALVAARGAVGVSSTVPRVAVAPTTRRPSSPAALVQDRRVHAPSAPLTVDELADGLRALGDPLAAPTDALDAREGMR